MSTSFLIWSSSRSQVVSIIISASLDAQVAVYQDYPLVAPIFAITLNWKYERTYLNDEAIRDMEREINIYHDFFSTKPTPGWPSFSS